MEPSPRIELGPPPYQSGAIPLCYKGEVPTERLELSLERVLSALPPADWATWAK